MKKLILVIVSVILTLSVIGAETEVGKVYDCKEVTVSWDKGHSKLTYIHHGSFAVELCTGELLLSTMAAARNDTDDYLKIQRINETVSTALTQEFLVRMNDEQYKYWMEHATYTDGSSPLTRTWETVESELKTNGVILAPGESVELNFAIKLKRKFNLQEVNVLLQDVCTNIEFNE